MNHLTQLWRGNVELCVWEYRLISMRRNIAASNKNKTNKNYRVGTHNMAAARLWCDNFKHDDWWLTLWRNRIRFVSNLYKTFNIQFDVAKIQGNQPIMQSCWCLFFLCHISMMRLKMLLGLLEQQPFQTIPSLPRSLDIAKRMFV